MMSAYRLGTWAAGAVAAIGHAYITVLIAGFVQVGFDAPIGDPVLAAMEILTLFSAPAVLITMASVHHHAAPEHKILYWHPPAMQGYCPSPSSCWPGSSELNAYGHEDIYR
jgi:hypothetical protein